MELADARARKRLRDLSPTDMHEWVPVLVPGIGVAPLLGRNARVLFPAVLLRPKTKMKRFRNVPLIEPNKPRNATHRSILSRIEKSLKSATYDDTHYCFSCKS
jgi:hypothetical protein